MPKAEFHELIKTTSPPPLSLVRRGEFELAIERCLIIFDYDKNL